MATRVLRLLLHDDISARVFVEEQDKGGLRGNALLKRGFEQATCDVIGSMVRVAHGHEYALTFSPTTLTPYNLSVRVDPHAVVYSGGPHEGFGKRIA